MATDKQIKANIENSKLGGVKTEEGKAISRFNALKHGILGSLISQYDNDVNLEILMTELKEELQPKGLIQEMLVERIGLNYLRMMRATKIEKNLLESIINPPLSEKVYKNPEAGKKYLQAKKESDDYFPNLLRELNKIPEEPEYEMVLKGGEKQQFKEEQIKYLAECIDRYYISSENRFYQAINMFWEIKDKE